MMAAGYVRWRLRGAIPIVLDFIRENEVTTAEWDEAIDHAKRVNTDLTSWMVYGTARRLREKCTGTNATGRR